MTMAAYTVDEVIHFLNGVEGLKVQHPIMLQEFRQGNNTIETSRKICSVYS